MVDSTRFLKASRKFEASIEGKGVLEYDGSGRPIEVCSPENEESGYYMSCPRWPRD